jgi:hypothetical protein
MSAARIPAGRAVAAEEYSATRHWLLDERSSGGALVMVVANRLRD